MKLVTYKIILKQIFSILILFLILSCSNSRWYAVEELPAETKAYIRDNYYLSGDYVTGAAVVRIDGVDSVNKSVHELSLGMHKIAISCGEARGSFDTDHVKSQIKTLELDARIQRTYKVACKPFSHWWIEDLENGAVVAGAKPTSEI